MSKPDITKVFAKRLRDARKVRGLSQNALGLQMGLSETSARTRIHRYENGTMAPDLRSAKEVADALGVSLSLLVCEDANLAKLIEGFGRLTPEARKSVLAHVRQTLKVEKNLANRPQPATSKKQTRRRVSK
jgi:transcriptional regulator with XRE-family HTH domain